MSVRRRRLAWVRCVLTCSLMLLLAPSPSGVAGPLDGWSSDNVEFITNIPVPYAGGAVLNGRHLFVLHGNGLDVFNVSEPESPERVSQLLFPARQFASFVDPDTNGRILLASTSIPAPGPTGVGDLRVIDVRDPRHPVVLASLPGAGDHTMTCILDCTWAYGGSYGHIIDLRDPKNPVLQEERWSDELDFAASTYGAFHDVTEVAPGFVLTASVPMYLLDVRKDPRRPRPIAKSDGSPYTYGGVTWPRGGRDRFIMSFGQPGVSMPSCTSSRLIGGTTINSGFKTWDTSNWKKTRLFTGLDEYVPEDGMYSDGRPPASYFPFVGGCQAAWFDPHPSFDDGGLVATAYGGYGIRFLAVGPSGKIEEAGYWLGMGRSAAFAARWITDEIVYALHVDRGIDVLRFVQP